jgi:hypothetical protein
VLNDLAPYSTNFNFLAKTDANPWVNDALNRLTAARLVLAKRIGIVDVPGRVAEHERERRILALARCD